MDQAQGGRNQLIRYVVTAGLAASEVGALLIVQAIIGLAIGKQSWGFLLDIPVMLALGAWLWWKRSPIAAALMLAVVALDYGAAAHSVGASNPFLIAYLAFF